MKIAKLVLLLFLISTASILYFGCDDSGTVPTEVRAGTITFTQVNKFQTMNPVNDGLYNLWLIVTDTNGVPRVLNLGRFNVSSNGSIVDGSGNPLDLAMNLHDTIDLPRALYALVTIESGVVGSPGPTRLISGTGIGPCRFSYRTSDFYRLGIIWYDRNINSCAKCSILSY